MITVVIAILPLSEYWPLAESHLPGLENLLLRRADILALVGQPFSFENASRGFWGSTHRAMQESFGGKSGANTVCLP